VIFWISLIEINDNLECKVSLQFNAMKITKGNRIGAKRKRNYCIVLITLLELLKFLFVKE